MSLLNSLILTTFAAYFAAGANTYPDDVLDYLPLILPVIVAVLWLSQMVGKILLSIWVFVWIAVHSPQNWNEPGQVGRVIRSNGCGLIQDDILVSAGGSTWVARSKALLGDEVIAGRAMPNSPFPPAALVLAPTQETSALCSFASSLRSSLMERLEVWGVGQREWLQSFVLGADSKIDSVTLSSLRKLGLLHIVVLSGGHLVVISAFVLFALRLFPMILYVFRILTMRTWPVVWMLSIVTSVMAVTAFSLAVGLSQSVQRALFMFVLLQLGPMIFGVTSKWTQIRVAWVLQCLLFPVHIFSMSTLLTWFGSLILSAGMTSRYRRSIWFSLRQDVYIQAAFAILSLVIFGRLGLLSIFANLVFGPIFSVFLVGNLGLFWLDHRSFISTSIVSLQMWTLDVVRRLAAFQQEYPFLTIRCPDFLNVAEPSGKMVLFAALVVLVSKVKRREV